MKAPCKDCGQRLHETVAVGRFDPDRPTTFRAASPGAPERGTRGEAQADSCEMVRRTGVQR